MPEPADRPPLRDQIASAIGGTMILRTSVDEITEAVMQVVHPHLKPQAEAARRMDDPGPLRDRIADRLGQSIAQWWQTPPRLDLAAGAVMPVIEAETAALRQRIEEAERERDEALAAVADEQQRADERRTELLEERDEALNALADAERERDEALEALAYGAETLRHAEQAERELPPVEHVRGANAEDCPACAGRRDLPYPFICPGTDPTERRPR